MAANPAKPKREKKPKKNFSAELADLGAKAALEAARQRPGAVVLPSVAPPQSLGGRVTASGSFQVAGQNGELITVTSDGIRSPVRKENYSHLHVVELDGVGKKLHFSDLDIPDDSQLLGQGAQGKVKKVLHTPSSTYLAMKVIPFTAPKKTAFRELQRVMQDSLSTRKCPYIVRSYEAFFRQNHLHILMEYMESGSLLDILNATKSVRARGMTEEEATIVAYHVMLGLNEVHKMKMIHRDIKPANLLVQMGRVKIADFGVATLVNTCELAVTSPNGAQLYMSPERINLEDFSYPADVWSLGLVLAQCVIGNYPFPVTTIFDLSCNIASGEVTVEFSDDLNLSAEFKDFVAQCTKHSWLQRPSVEQLLQHPLMQLHHPESKTLQPLLQEIDAALNLGTMKDTVHFKTYNKDDVKRYEQEFEEVSTLQRTGSNGSLEESGPDTPLGPTS